MTNLQLLAEVRRFFPHARLWLVRRGAVIVGLRGRSRLSVSSTADGLVWFASRERGREFVCAMGETPAEALRALGFAERVPAWRLPMWLQLKMLRDGRNACPLQSTQRPRKGVRFGKRRIAELIEEGERYRDFLETQMDAYYGSRRF